MDRELNFLVEKAELKTCYGITLATYENVSKLPINTNRSYYESNLGILYIHEGEGKLDIELALKPLLYLKQALLHTSFINELDKALIGEYYNPLFKNAVNEFILLYDYNFESKRIQNEDFNTLMQELIAKIS